MPTNKPEVVLPELPVSVARIHSDGYWTTDDRRPDWQWPSRQDVFTADQLRAYGQACIDAISAAPLQSGLDAFFFVNRGDSENNFVADGEHLNCPACGGSGHVDDVQPQQPAEAVAVDDDKIIEIARKCFLPHERSAYDKMTFERSPPLFPQASYDVPTIGLTNFVKSCIEAFAAPPAIDIGKLRGAVETLNHAIATQLGARVTIHATRARQIRDELAALIGGGGEAENG